MSTSIPSAHPTLSPVKSFVGLGVIAGGLSVIFAIAVGISTSIIVLLVTVAVFLLSAFRVDALLYASVFFLPLEPTLPTGFLIHDVSAILRITMFLGLCTGAYMEGRPIRKLVLAGRLSYWAAGFGLVSLLSAVLFNHPSTDAQGALLRLLSYLCFYFTVADWLRTEQHVETVVAMLLLSTILVAFFGLYQAAINDLSQLYFWIYPNQAQESIAEWTGRVTSFLNYYNSLAGYLNLVLPFALACIVIRVNRTLRYLGMVCLAAALIALILTQSRGGVFAFGGTLLSALFLLVGKSRDRKGIALAVLASVCIALPFLIQFSTRFATIEDDSGLMRYALWAVAATMFLSSPLVGIGYGNFRNLYSVPGFMSGVFDVHNLYLQLLTETGVLGFIVFTGLVVVALRAAWSCLRRAQYTMDQIVGFAAFASIVTVLIHGFVDYLFIVSPQFGALFWMVLGMLTARDHFRENRIHENIGNL